VKANKTSIRLADGRELIFYDEHPGADRQVRDTRDLGRATIRSEIRYDPLLDEWVVLASHRQDRTHLPPAELCPLCPSTPTHKTEIPSPEFVPAAARWPFEIHLYPTRHLPDLPALDDDERDGLGVLLQDVLAPFDGLFDLPMPYMATWHQAPVRLDRDLAHLHLEIFSIRRAANKLKYLASSESGAGVFINDVGAERAAELLRQAAD
jgi:galactose-1-phosphate uridylyltransferase